MNSIGVFCGSSRSSSPRFIEIAQELGNYLGRHQLTLIYGGAQVGLMGEVANATLNSQGKVVGVIPEMLKTKEVVHPNLSRLITVNTMHERKSKMYEMNYDFFSASLLAASSSFGVMSIACPSL